MKPKIYDYKDVRPALGKFKLEATGDAEHVFRKITVDDEEWIRQNFPGRALKDFFIAGSEITATEMSKVYFHFVVDKSHFKPRHVMVTDEDTLEEREERFPAWRVFMKSITNLEVMPIIKAFMETATGSDIKDVTATITDQKKKKDKKSVAPIGEASSTNSKASTGGPQTSSEA